MTFDGLIDYNPSNIEAENVPMVDKKADHAFGFMFSSLNHRFRQPIGMFASKVGTPTERLSLLVTAAIIQVEKAGGKVHGLVCDGASTNRALWPHFGIQAKVNEPIKCSFPNLYDDSRQIYIISDVPHLIKCIRNNLYNRKEFKV